MRTTISVSVHVNSDTHIATVDYTPSGSRFVAVKVGEAGSPHGTTIFLSSHDDAVRLIKAAERAASFLLTAEAVA